MHIFKRIFLFIALAAVFFWNVGCSLDSGDINKSSDNDQPVATDPENNVTFVNKTDLMVKVFSDSLKTNLLTTINYGENFSCNADINAAGNVFYYTYYLALDKVLIPYGTGQSIVNLSQDKLATVNIIEPTEVNTNKNIVILENLSTSAIALEYAHSELHAENMTSSLLNQDEHGIYLLENHNLSDYKIFDAGKNISLSEAPTADKGYIYYFAYTGKEVVLNSKTFLNKDLKDKSWKISLSQKPGKTLVASHLISRKKSENGYMLFARQAYNYTDLSLEDTVPYYTFISPNGEIQEEQTPIFKDNPKNVKIKGCIDTGDYILAVGEKKSSDDISSAFLMGIQGLNIYKDIYFADETGDENNLFAAQTMVQKTDNTFCALVYKNIYSAPGYNDDNYISTVLGLVEVTVDSFTSVSTKILWESNEDSDFVGAYSDLVYDEASDTYVVLTWNNVKKSTEILFIDGTSGAEKIECVVLDSYDFNRIVRDNDKNIFLCGALINQLTDTREACVIGIDISTGTLTDSTPKTFPTKDRNLSSYFNDIVFEDDYVIYAGSTDYKYGGNLNDTIPYIVAYDVTEDKVLWEKRFDNLTGYGIYSCSDTDISFVYELYNESTRHSYIVSAGLMGEIPEDVKLTLPQNSSITEIEAPDVTIYFYNNSDDTNNYVEATFKCGDEITLRDLEEYAPTDIQVGYKVTGWYDKDTDTENKLITFPYTIEKSPLRFYPRIGSLPSAIGDIAYSDGSVSTDYDNTKSAVGIVIEVTNNVATKIVSLTETSVEWSTECVITNATSTTDGMTNLTTIQSITNWKSKYPAFKWCDDYTDESDNSNWYLPAKNELNQIYIVKDTINKAIDKIINGGGTAHNLHTYESEYVNCRYWSSSESHDSGSWYQKFSDGEQYNRVTGNDSSKTLIRYVRAVRAF